MSRFAQVVAKSNLIQLDRVFDFVIPEAMVDQIAIGQQVSFPFGRAKKMQHGFVVGLSNKSDYATSELDSILHQAQVLTPEIYSFARQVADRQCVALGEILAAAVPDHMARTVIDPAADLDLPAIEKITGLPFEIRPELSNRAALLSAAKSYQVGEHYLADWAFAMIFRAFTTLAAGKSAICVVPDQKDIDELNLLAEHFGLRSFLVNYLPGDKKSDRFKSFHKALNQPVALVIGTRSAIYAPVSNLGLIALYDDLDDSLREQGSPFTHARELAMMRAGKSVSLMLVAPYRSVEVQRLVEIGYLSDHDINAAPARISYTEPGVRFDESAFKLVRERLGEGPVLVLLPRKGSSAALYCQGCGERLRCGCGGMIWEPSENRALCRICNKPHVKCEKCQSGNFKRGRTGSTRTVSELGKVFPQTAIAEATHEKTPSGLKPKNQIVVATPGSAPKVKGGYAALLILDCDIWLAKQSLDAEQLAFRDWTGALEMLAGDGRAVLSGVDSEIGQAFAMQQHRQMAKAQLQELRGLGLPPAVRIASVESAPEQMEQVLEISKTLKAKVLSVDAAKSKVLLSFGYQAGPEISKSLRALALKTAARVQGGSKRRGLRVVMDDPDAL
jgi:primosomal protein N' (replication factor Y) (superfamily II helicase)